MEKFIAHEVDEGWRPFPGLKELVDIYLDGVSAHYIYNETHNKYYVVACTPPYDDDDDYTFGILTVHYNYKQVEWQVEKVELFVRPYDLLSKIGWADINLL